MTNESSPNRRSDIHAGIFLLKVASEGHLDGLPCPQCNKATVSVWFTHPSPMEYRTWFLCGNCDFELRAQNSGRPPHFSEERDRTGKASASAVRHMMKNSENPPIRDDVLDRLRLMAQRGTTVRKLVRFVQNMLGYDESAYVPVLAYLTKAFGLQVREVLPIREWIGSDNDNDINAVVMPAIERNRQYWLPLISHEVAVPE